MPTLDDILQAAQTLAEYYDARATGAKHTLDASYYRNTAKILRQLVDEHESAARDIGKLTTINGDLVGENARLREALQVAESWIADGGHAESGAGRKIYRQIRSALENRG